MSTADSLNDENEIEKLPCCLKHAYKINPNWELDKEKINTTMVKN